MQVTQHFDSFGSFISSTIRDEEMKISSEFHTDDCLPYCHEEHTEKGEPISGSLCGGMFFVVKASGKNDFIIKLFSNKTITKFDSSFNIQVVNGETAIYDAYIARIIITIPQIDKIY